MKKVYGVGINDMRGKWCSDKRIAKTEEQKYQSTVYHLWKRMFQRCYSEKYLERNPTYRGCQVCVRWRKLSNFIKDIAKIPNYELWLNNPGKRISLDKDILLKGNKVYHPKLVKLVTMQENTREMLKRTNFKASKVNASKTSKAVIGTSIKDGSIIEFKSVSKAEKEGGFTRTHIKACCRGKRKTHKGYIWRYKD